MDSPQNPFSLPNFGLVANTSPSIVETLPVVFDVDIALPLGEFGAVRVHDEREVRELRGVPPERLVQQQVLRCRHLCLMRIQLLLQLDRIIS